MKKIYMILTFIFIPLLGYCDDPVEITGTANKYQKPAVVLESFFWQNGELIKSYCSGALVGRNIVFTAAHCVINEGGKATYVKVLANGVPEQPSVEAFEVVVAKEFQEGDRDTDKHDYAFVLLDTPLGDELGYFELKKHSVLGLLHKKIQVLGRGHDKPLNTLWAIDGKVRPFFLVSPPQKYFIEFDAEIKQANSGGPVVLADDPGNIIALANNTFYSEMRKDKYHSEGLLITSPMKRMLMQLRKDYEESEKVNNTVAQVNEQISNSISDENLSKYFNRIGLRER